MTTAFLMLPVLLVLVWLYWYLLPGRQWRWIDSLLLLAVTLAATVYIVVTARIDFTGAGPLWPQIVSVVGTYAIILLGLGSALLWRRSQRRTRTRSRTMSRSGSQTGTTEAS